jgi:hypothetical protein
MRYPEFRGNGKDCEYSILSALQLTDCYYPRALSSEPEADLRSQPASSQFVSKTFSTCMNSPQNPKKKCLRSSPVIQAQSVRYSASKMPLRSRLAR